MMPKLPSLSSDAPRNAPSHLVLVGILALAALIRVIYVGDRSLWLDELSTWHVSRLPLAESLVWPAELSPPLYQLCLRALGGGTHPPEWLLRIPAAIAGILTVAAIWRLVRLCGDAGLTATAAGLLAATHILLIDYSREARPYAFLVLFVTLAMCAALRLTRERTAQSAWEWIAWATLALYSHTFAGFSLLACALFWVGSWMRSRDRALLRSASLAALVTLVLALPLAARSWQFRRDIAEGLKWIDPPTIQSFLHVVAAIAPGGSARTEDLTAGLIGLGIVLAAVAIGLIMAARKGTRETQSDGLVLLTIWIGCAFGLPLILSLAGRPLLVPRFFLPAAVPLLLLPLLLLARAAPRIVVGVTLVLLTLQALGARRVLDMPPAGLRELVAFVNQSVQREDAAVVLCIYAARPEFADYERLGLRYYAPTFGAASELHLNNPDSPANAVLRDPRPLYLIVFQGDPRAILQAAGRELEPIVDLSGAGRPLHTLYFEPYRLLRVAPR